MQEASFKARSCYEKVEHKKWNVIFVESIAEVIMFIPKATVLLEYDVLIVIMKRGRENLVWR